MVNPGTTQQKPPQAATGLTHVKPDGTPGMVDVSDKLATERQACARARVTLPHGVSLFGTKQAEIQVAKGSLFATAIAAGTLAVKKTPELIPLCHSLPITGCTFDFETIDERAVNVWCTVKTKAATGVEMEAIVGASMAAATLYDMCKSLGQDICIGPIELMSKTGGKHDFTREPRD